MGPASSLHPANLGRKWWDMLHSVFMLLAVSGGTSSDVAPGLVVAWGDDGFGQTAVPEGLMAVQVDTLSDHTVARTSDGGVVAWGRNDWGQCDLPDEPKWIDADAGGGHTILLSESGQAVGIGWNAFGQCDAPEGEIFSTVDAGYYHSVGLTMDGRLLAWGLNLDGRTEPPLINDGIDISCGAHHTLVLRSDGSVLAWGRNDEGQCNVPSDLGYQSISAAFTIPLRLAATKPPRDGVPTRSRFSIFRPRGHLSRLFAGLVIPLVSCLTARCRCGVSINTVRVMSPRGRTPC